MTERYFASKGITADVRLSYGATEAKIPDIADCVVEITETGRALRAAGLRIIDTILISYTEMVANKASFDDPVKRHAMDQLMTLLLGTLDARDKVLVKLNVDTDHFKAVLAVLPSAKSPTISELASGGYAIESVVERAHDQHPDPRVERRRRLRHLGVADQQDRCLTCAARSRRSTKWSASARSLATTAGRAVPLHRDCRRQPRHPRRDRRRVRPDVQARPLRSRPRRRGMNERDQRILDVIRALREGEVVTYGDIAEDAGYPKRSRLVGHILATTDDDVPWWRVVNSVGSLVPGHEREQAAILRSEGVKVGGGPRSAKPVRSVQLTLPGQLPASVAALIWTNARRMLDSASTASAPPRRARSPSPSTRQATASMANAASPSRAERRRVDRGQLVQTHHVVDDHRLGGTSARRARASFSASWASSTTDSVSSLLTCGIVSADNSSRSGVAA